LGDSISRNPILGKLRFEALAFVDPLQKHFRFSNTSGSRLRGWPFGEPISQALSLDPAARFAAEPLKPQMGQNWSSDISQPTCLFAERELLATRANRMGFGMNTYYPLIVATGMLINRVPWHPLQFFGSPRMQKQRTCINRWHCGSDRSEEEPTFLNPQTIVYSVTLAARIGRPEGTPFQVSSW